LFQVAEGQKYPHLGASPQVAYGDDPADERVLANYPDLRGEGGFIVDGVVLGMLPRTVWLTRSYKRRDILVDRDIRPLRR
jgi:hypothetical protein